jgi:hypothetical protein
VLGLLPAAARAASHSDAPLIKQDPQANITDVYAFVGTRFDDAAERMLNVIVQVRPFSEPGDGAIYERFADATRYSIHVAHPTSGETLLRYDFEFSDVNPLTFPGLKDPDTALSYGVIQDVGDPQHNYTQTYSVRKAVGRKKPQPLGAELLTPPPNLGKRATPHYNDSTTGQALSGAVTFAALDRYTGQTVHALPSGEVAFAGSREDGFYADVPGIFDLLDGRIFDNDGNPSDGLGQDGNGVDGFKGFNVLVFALQIPIASLPSFPYTAPFADLAQPLPALGEANGVGVYASVSRRRVTLRRAKKEPSQSGPWIQVNRMGNPLFNEALVALRDKDTYNRTAPTGDAATFASFASNPELALLINSVHGTAFVTTGRADLELVFVPDLLRVDTTTPAVRLAGEAGFSRFGFAGGDTTTDGAARIKSSGWPNGRRLGDDVVDIALTAIASGPSYALVTVVGDNVAANDQLYHQVFPYAATPHAGTVNRKDP